MQVEFVADDTAPPAAPATTRRPPARRLIGAGLVGAAVLGCWAVTQPDGPSAPRPPASTGPVACATGAPMSDEIAEAMHSFLPGIRLRNLDVYRCVRGSGDSGRIVFEEISGRYGELDIHVETALPGDRRVLASQWVGLQAEYGLVGRTESVDALHVAVGAYGPGSAEAPLDRMRRLSEFISLDVVL